MFATNTAVALVPSSTKAGDVLILLEMTSCVGLVVRQHNTRCHQFIVTGQALIDPFARACHDVGSCDCGMPGEAHIGSTARMVLCFDPEDLLLFVCQDLRLQQEGLYSRDDDNRHERPTNRFTAIDPVLAALRLETAVVRSDDGWSSYAEMVSSEAIKYYFDSY